MCSEIKAGADIVSVHFQQSSTVHLHRTLNLVIESECAPTNWLK